MTRQQINNPSNAFGLPDPVDLGLPGDIRSIFAYQTGVTVPGSASNRRVSLLPAGDSSHPDLSLGAPSHADAVSTLAGGIVEASVVKVDTDQIRLWAQISCATATAADALVTAFVCYTDVSEGQNIQALGTQFMPGGIDMSGYDTFLFQGFVNDLAFLGNEVEIWPEISVRGGAGTFGIVTFTLYGFDAFT